jgi:hypothetical protein
MIDTGLMLMTVTVTCCIPSQGSPPKFLNDRVCSLTNKKRERRFWHDASYSWFYDFKMK